MLRHIAPEQNAKTVAGFVPPITRPLVDAISTGRPLTSALLDIANELGFDDFIYFVATGPNPTTHTPTCIWTSVTRDWTRLYEERRYVEVDPCLRHAWSSLLPVVWDRTTCARSAREHAFFDDAAIFGICSGVAVTIRNRFDAPGTLVLSSIEKSMDADRRRHLRTTVGQVLVLGTFVHDLLRTSAVGQALPDLVEGVSLTPQERRCLEHAAQGLNSREIGKHLRISERTVHTHIAHVLEKLGAANRQEAIARATAAGLIAA